LLAKNPAERPGSAQEVADALAAIAVSPAAAAPSSLPTLSVRTPRHSKPRSRPLALVAVAGVLLVAAGLVAYLVSRPGRTGSSAGSSATPAEHRATVPPTAGKEPGEPAGSGQILNGGGSSFIYPLLDKWAAEYKREKGVKVNYVPTGSGAGIQELTSLALDFCCSDAPLTPAQLERARAAGGEVMYVPLALGGIVPAYNLDGIDKPLRFSGPVLADIFLGHIKKWNDPALKELNPGVALPNQAIVVVHRQDSSGSTYIFTEFLSKVSKDWQKEVGTGDAVKWPVGIAARGSDGMVEAMAARPGAIAYVELLYALRGKLKFGAVKNRAGSYLQGSLETVTAAAEKISTDIPADMQISLTYVAGKESYPICGCTWAILYVKQPAGRGQRLVDFLRWVTRDGQEYNTDLYYARLPEALADRVAQRLETIRVGE
jgi:phosphate transport system substrate-binding protein